MRVLLDELRSAPGVAGVVLCDARRRVLAHTGESNLEATLLGAIGSAVAACSNAAAEGGATHLLDLRYGNVRVAARATGNAFLILFLDASARIQELIAPVSAALRRCEQRHPAGVAPAAMVPSAPAGRSQSAPAARLQAVPAARPPPRLHAVPSPQAAPAPGVQPAPPPSAPTVQISSTPPPVQGGPPRPAPRLRMLLAAGFALLLAVGAGAGAAYASRARSGRNGPTTTQAAASSAQAAGSQASGTAEVVLRIAGVDALASRLVSELVSAYLTEHGASGVEIRLVQPELTAVEGTVGARGVAIEIAAEGARDGFAALREKRAEVAVTTRRIYPAEKRQLSSLGDMTGPENERVVGLDGIAVIVSKANPVKTLNREQLGGILGGASRQWSAFGANLGAIHVYLLDERFGVPAVLETAVLGDRPLLAEAKRLPSYQAVADAVFADPSGIGLVPMNAVTGARALPLSDADEPPLLPSPLTVASEDYILSHRIYLYTLPGSTNPYVSGFARFALSAPGQAVIRKAGLVELGVKVESRPMPAGAPAEYVRLAGGARRLSSTLRFELGSTSFDRRAEQDLDRIAEYLKENNLNGEAVRVLGYADRAGSPAVNQQLSLSRAEQVAQALAERGIGGVITAGMGSSLPVAEDGSEEGGRRNRRVEIWVTAR